MFRYLLSMKYLLVILFFLFSTKIYSQSVTITTFAGNGLLGNSGDGGPATGAKFSWGCPSMEDGNGNMYISTGVYSYRVRIVSSSGIIDKFAGNSTTGFSGDGGPATTAQFKEPCYIAIDDSENVYVADALNYRIRKIDHNTGIIATIVGNGRVGIDTDGMSATATGINIVTCIAFDKYNNLLFNAGALYIKKVDHITGLVSTIAGTGTAVMTSGDGGPATAATGNFYYFYVCKNGDIISSDRTSSIRRISHSTGIITTIAGTRDTITTYADNIPATNAHIYPSNLWEDSSGNIYFSDAVHDRIRYIDTIGIIHSIAGTGISGTSGEGVAADSANLGGPWIISMNPCGDLYFQEIDNHRIRKLNLGRGTLASVQVNIGDTVIHLCNRRVVSLNAVGRYAGRYPHFSWTVNSIPAGTDTPYFSYTPANGDVVTCTMVSSLNCLSDATASSNSVHIFVDTLSPPNVTITGIAGAAIGDTVHLNATITGAGSSYILKWYNSDSLFATTTTPTVQYVKTRAIDSITVVLTSNARGCYDSTGSPIKTIVRYNTSAPVVVKSNEIWLQPNPAQTEIQILAGNDWEQLVVTDVSGRVMYREVNQQHRSTQLNIASWPKGLYFVHTGTVAGKFLKD